MQVARKKDEGAAPPEKSAEELAREAQLAGWLSTHGPHTEHRQGRIGVKSDKRFDRGSDLDVDYIRFD